MRTPGLSPSAARYSSTAIAAARARRVDAGTRAISPAHACTQLSAHGHMAPERVYASDTAVAPEREQPRTHTACPTSLIHATIHVHARTAHAHVCTRRHGPGSTAAASDGTPLALTRSVAGAAPRPAAHAPQSRHPAGGYRRALRRRARTHTRLCTPTQPPRPTPRAPPGTPPHRVRMPYPTHAHRPSAANTCDVHISSV